MNYETKVRSEQADGAPDVTYGADAEAPRSSKGRWILAALIIVLLIGGAAAYYYMQGAGEDAAAAGDDESQLPAVTVIAPGQTTIEGEINATGTLAARREMPVGVVGEGGRVARVTVDAGDYVNAGQVLVVIDRSVQAQQARSASANIDVAQADANLAQSNLDRALKLVDRGFISKADVDRLTATRDAAVARVRVARAQLSELNARNARLNIVAPAAGLVLERSVEPGQTVGAGSGPLFRIARGGEMEMMAQVSESDLANLSVGVAATVTPAGSEAQFEGQVWQLAPTIDPQSRQGVARVALPYDRALRPGGFANAVIRSGTVVAPMLPESAVLSDDEGSFVYVIDDENKAQRRAITTGMVTEDGIAIAEGLDGSERIVLRAGGFLSPGEKVSPRLLKSEAE